MVCLRILRLLPEKPDLSMDSSGHMTTTQRAGEHVKDLFSMGVQEEEEEEGFHMLTACFL